MKLRVALTALVLWIAGAVPVLADAVVIDGIRLSQGATLQVLGAEERGARILALCIETPERQEVCTFEPGEWPQLMAMVDEARARVAGLPLSCPRSDELWTWRSTQEGDEHLHVTAFAAAVPDPVLGARPCLALEIGSDLSRLRAVVVEAELEHLARVMKNGLAFSRNLDAELPPLPEPQYGRSASGWVESVSTIGTIASDVPGVDNGWLLRVSGGALQPHAVYRVRVNGQREVKVYVRQVSGAACVIVPFGALRRNDALEFQGTDTCAEGASF